MFCELSILLRCVPRCCCMWSVTSTAWEESCPAISNPSIPANNGERRFEFEGIIQGKHTKTRLYPVASSTIIPRNQSGKNGFDWPALLINAINQTHFFGFRQDKISSKISSKYLAGLISNVYGKSRKISWISISYQSVVVVSHEFCSQTATKYFGPELPPPIFLHFYHG